MSPEFILDLRVNGDRHRVLVPAERTLLELLREDLDLIGTKHGCDVGDCGACTVWVDGHARLSCITLASDAHEREVTTIEGMGRAELHPVQQAFHDHVAAQCGYCTPGFVMALAALLRDEPDASDTRLTEILGANICRCTGYTKILAAAKQARDRST
jgi:aerobic-type carbon monoxide dehydrogenase small subunit (CoxS/CutS family)